MSTERLASDPSTLDVAALLTQGALVITESREARDRSQQMRANATWLRQGALALNLRFNAHWLPPISGASAPTEDTERIRRKLRAFASFGTAKTFVGQSRGAACDACDRKILLGEIEYELVADAHEMRLESDCYLLLIEELRMLTSASDPAR